MTTQERRDPSGAGGPRVSGWPDGVIDQGSAAAARRRTAEARP